MSNEEDALPANDDSKVDAVMDRTPEPRSSEHASKLRIEMYRQVIEPAMYLLVNFIWRVLLLAAGVWLLTKFFGR
jgi:hypothetical protein